MAAEQRQLAREKNHLESKVREVSSRCYSTHGAAKLPRGVVPFDPVDEMVDLATADLSRRFVSKWRPRAVVMVEVVALKTSGSAEGADQAGFRHEAEEYHLP